MKDMKHNQKDSILRNEAVDEEKVRMFLSVSEMLRRKGITKSKTFSVSHPFASGQSSEVRRKIVSLNRSI